MCPWAGGARLGTGSPRGPLSPSALSEAHPASSPGKGEAGGSRGGGWVPVRAIAPALNQPCPHIHRSGSPASSRINFPPPPQPEAAARSQESPYLASSAGPVELPLPSSQPRNLQEARTVSQQHPWGFSPRQTSAVPRTGLRVTRCCAWCCDTMLCMTLCMPRSSSAGLVPPWVFRWHSKVQPSEANYKQSRAEMSQIAGYRRLVVLRSPAWRVPTFQPPQITKRGAGDAALPSAEGPSPPQPQAKMAS